MQVNQSLVQKKKSKTFLPYFFIAPALILFGLFTIYPFIKTIVLSFTLTDKYGNPQKFVGLKMWKRVLSSNEFWKVMVVTLKVAVINLLGTFFIALFFALLSTEQVRGGKIYQTMYALPMAIASAPAAAIFVFVFRQKWSAQQYFGNANCMATHLSSRVVCSLFCYYLDARGFEFYFLACRI